MSEVHGMRSHPSWTVTSRMALERCSPSTTRGRQNTIRRWPRVGRATRTDGILVFTGLFSATIATFITLSIQNLQPNSQGASAFSLSRIYGFATGSNDSSILSPPVFSDPSTFSASASALWVNVLWFLSLVISLNCALLATMLQQWARRYPRITQPRSSPHKCARIRELMTQGVEKMHLPWAVEALPALLHASVFLFLAGSSYSYSTSIIRCSPSYLDVSASVPGCMRASPSCPFSESTVHTPLLCRHWSGCLAWPCLTSKRRSSYSFVMEVTSLSYAFAVYSRHFDAAWTRE
ncbi:hypothetical protein BC834DRAFT_66167 [Gloeopeniophorella convolvens]|nr:hypothetical protein BC834DRAFT_66167 [Gloeopeniophorella convolvens]